MIFVMFDKLKKLNELRNLQNNMKKERAEAVRNGVKVAIDGSLDIVEIKLNPELDISTQERLLKECFDEAKGKIQMLMAKSFAGMI